MRLKNYGWVVTLAGFGVNLILGILYSWSIISAVLIDDFGWTATMTQVPYMVACVVFAFSMIPAGRGQDRYGPKRILIFSAILAGIGFIFSGLFVTLIGLTIFFGIIFGLSIGLGYSTPTPAAVKWFEKTKRGLISGIVVSGFGLAPIYIAPLSHSLIAHFGIHNTFFILGAGFFIVLLVFSRIIANPPADYIPVENTTAKKIKASSRSEVTYDWKAVLKTRQFSFLWVMFFFGTFAGLLLIGQLSKIGSEQAGITTPFLPITVYALFNCFGRILFGFISDAFGRMRTLLSMFLLQMVVYSLFIFLRTEGFFLSGVAVVGLTFGGMLSLFPACMADFYGMKNFGVNYGMLITAWGIGGLIGPFLGGLFRDQSGGYLESYIISATLSGIGALMTFFVKFKTARVKD